MSWTTLIHWLQGPLGIVAACWAFSALLHTLTPPDATSGRLYATFYGIVQFIGANFALIFGRPLPPVVTVNHHRDGQDAVASLGDGDADGGDDGDRPVRASEQMSSSHEATPWDLHER